MKKSGCIGLHVTTNKSNTTNEDIAKEAHEMEDAFHRWEFEDITNQSI